MSPVEKLIINFIKKKKVNWNSYLLTLSTSGSFNIISAPKNVSSGLATAYN